MYVANNLYNNNNVNFQAKFRINQEVNILDKERWANIGKIIEQKTAKYPNDSIAIETYKDEPEPISLVLRGGFEESSSTITKKGLEKLLKLNDNTIANKILKLFRVHIKNDKIADSTCRFINYVENSSKKALLQNESFPDIEKQTWDCVNEIQQKNEDYVISRDSFLRNPDYFRFRDVY